MRLPLILSTMIAALAIPVVLASQATDPKPADTASTEASTDSTSAAKAGAMEEKKEGKMGKKPKKKHHRKHKHRHEGEGGGVGHTPDPQDLPADEIPSDAGPGKQMPEEMVGQKGPNVPPGQ